MRDSVQHIGPVCGRHYQNNFSQRDFIVLLRIGLSLFIKKLYITVSLKSLGSLAKILKFSKDGEVLQNKECSKTAEISELVFLPVRAKIPKCSDNLALKWHLVWP